MYLLAFYVVPLVYVQSFVTYVVMYLFIKTLQLHHQPDLRLQHTILNKEIIHKALASQTYICETSSNYGLKIWLYQPTLYQPILSFQTNIYVFIMNIVVCYWISWISVALNPELSYLIFRFWAVEFYLEHFLRTFLNYISSSSTPIRPPNSLKSLKTLVGLYSKLKLWQSMLKFNPSESSSCSEDFLIINFYIKKIRKRILYWYCIELYFRPRIQPVFKRGKLS